MKNIRIIGSIVLFINLFFLTQCKKDDPEPKTERIRSLLVANTWIVQSVTVDGNDEADLFTGLTLSFTPTNYTTTNGGVVWPGSGTWQFADKTGKLITRNDGLQIVIEEISKNTLKLSLMWSTTTLGSGRSTALAGDHVFIFIPS